MVSSQPRLLIWHELVHLLCLKKFLLTCSANLFFSTGSPVGEKVTDDPPFPTYGELDTKFLRSYFGKCSGHSAERASKTELCKLL
jgi:hypothetical protein